MRQPNSNESYTNLVEANHLQSTEDINELLAGLHSAKKYISSRFFYDHKGSELFEQITRLPEYYPYTTEKQLLHNHTVGLLANEHHTDIIELGSGDCTKISIILDRIDPNLLHKYRYFPVDISDSALKKSKELLNRTYPKLTIKPIVANFMKHIELLPGTDGRRLILFLGSTIGNLTSGQALEFLTKIRNLMRPGDFFIVGFDRVKDTLIIEKAYNDSQGVTATFNKNILNVVNQHLQSDFNVADFEHNAFFNPTELRIEMHLKAMKDLQINTPFTDHPIVIRKGETIHTENSHKFTEQQIIELAAKSGLHIENIMSDENQWFSIVIFKK